MSNIFAVDKSEDKFSCATIPKRGMYPTHLYKETGRQDTHFSTCLVLLISEVGCKLMLSHI